MNINDYRRAMDKIAPDTELKERIMNQTNKKRYVPIRWVIAAAAVLAALTLTVAAVHLGAGELLGRFFTRPDGSPLTAAERTLLDELGTALPAVTNNGTTITPMAAINDAHNLFLYLHVEAPEGTVLPDMGEQEDHVFLDFDLRFTETGERSAAGMQKARWLSDPTPGDNVVELVFMLYGHYSDPELNPLLDFNDGAERTLYLKDLLLCPRERPEEALILEGEWSFPLAFSHPSLDISLDVAGLTRQDEETGAVLTLEELTISPLSITYCFSYTPSTDIPPLGLTVVLEDGTFIDINRGSGIVGPERSRGYHAFNFLIPLNSIDHLQFGDHQIYLPST